MKYITGIFMSVTTMIKLSVSSLRQKCAAVLRLSFSMFVCVACQTLRIHLLRVLKRTRFLAERAYVADKQMFLSLEIVRYAFINWNKGLLALCKHSHRHI